MKTVQNFVNGLIWKNRAEKFEKVFKEQTGFNFGCIGSDWQATAIFLGEWIDRNVKIKDVPKEVMEMLTIMDQEKKNVKEPLY